MKTAILVLSLLAAATAHAAVPRKISYQGYLRNAGAPVNGTVALTFNLYDAPAGGLLLWSEAFGSVSVANGVFNVALGVSTPLDLPFDKKYYLGIAVGSDAELTPRQPLASMPYSIRSSVTNAFVANAVTTSAIQLATIPPGKLASVCAQGQILMRSPTGWRCATW
jgi:hypothetical protein